MMKRVFKTRNCLKIILLQSYQRTMTYQPAFSTIFQNHWIIFPILIKDQSSLTFQRLQSPDSYINQNAPRQMKKKLIYLSFFSAKIYKPCFNTKDRGMVGWTRIFTVQAMTKAQLFHFLKQKMVLASVVLQMFSGNHQ